MGATPLWIFRLYTAPAVKPVRGFKETIKKKQVYEIPPSDSPLGCWRRPAPLDASLEKIEKVET